MLFRGADLLPLHHVSRAPTPARSQSISGDLVGLVDQVDKLPVAPVPSVLDYANAYRQGQLSPQMADRLVQQIEASNQVKAPSCDHCDDDQDIRRQAMKVKNAEGWQALSVLENVPVAVKDELDAIPHTTTAGTIIFRPGRFGGAGFDRCGTPPAAGAAIIIGKANMHEIGIGVTGSMCIMATAVTLTIRIVTSGGSSSGNAAAVASDLCPACDWADGGGSIRMAALCGMVGLKPTLWSREQSGAFPLGWSVGHIGPNQAATVDDVAIGYATMAGPDAGRGHQQLPHIW